MQTIAIIGTGIAGMSSAYFLHRDFQVTLYEKNDYIGGHTNTVEVQEEGASIPIDTGFMVYNEVTYPYLTRLFRELRVETMPTSMSFSVQHVPSGLEYSGSGWNQLFTQRLNLLSFKFWRLLKEIHRFNQEALEVLQDDRWNGSTIGDYLHARKYSQALADYYLLPMSSAVWSTEFSAMLDFPIVTLVRFFQNHGFLGMYTQHPWRTVRGGSRTYRDRLIAAFRKRIHCKRKVVQILEGRNEVYVTDESGQTQSYDRAILACHADQALKLLARPNPLQRRLLAPFHYQKNRATLHTDCSVMPQNQRAWASWNHRIDLSGATTIYFMNSLQKVSQNKNYFVSINDPGLVSPKLILQQIEYEHPVYNLKTSKAQQELHQLNEDSKILFCGSYFRYGFHEDALFSSVRLAQKILGREVLAS